MAINLTPDDLCCGGDSPCAQAYIDLVIARIGDCLEASYGTEQATLIAGLYACYFIEQASHAGQVTQEKAPNGAATSYSSGVTKQGLQSNRYGQQAYMLDTNQCWTGLIRQLFTFGTVGTSNPPVYS